MVAAYKERAAGEKDSSSSSLSTFSSSSPVLEGPFLAPGCHAPVVEVLAVAVAVDDDDDDDDRSQWALLA
jgi:hypothetical protein